MCARYSYTCRRACNSRYTYWYCIHCGLWLWMQNVESIYLHVIALLLLLLSQSSFDFCLPSRFPDYAASSIDCQVADLWFGHFYTWINIQPAQITDCFSHGNSNYCKQYMASSSWLPYNPVLHMASYVYIISMTSLYNCIIMFRRKCDQTLICHSFWRN